MLFLLRFFEAVNQPGKYSDLEHRLLKGGLDALNVKCPDLEHRLLKGGLDAHY